MNSRRHRCADAIVRVAITRGLLGLPALRGPLLKHSGCQRRVWLRGQVRASFKSTKPLAGNSGRYFAVRNNDSAKALSSLTGVREYDGLTPSQCSIASTVVTLNLAPLSP